MNYSNMCGGYCGTDDFELSKDDKKALLKEQEAILEAKLATIRHWMETSDKDVSDSGKK